MPWGNNESIMTAHAEIEVKNPTGLGHNGPRRDGVPTRSQNPKRPCLADHELTLPDLWLPMKQQLSPSEPATD